MCPAVGPCCEAARCARADHPAHPQLPHRPQVRAVGDRVRRQAGGDVRGGHKGDPLAADVTDHEAVGGRPVRRVDRDLLGVVEERVEPRPSEHPDLARLAHTSPPGVQILGRVVARPRLGCGAGGSPQPQTTPSAGVCQLELRQCLAVLAQCVGGSSRSSTGISARTASIACSVWTRSTSTLSSPVRPVRAKPTLRSRCTVERMTSAAAGIPPAWGLFGAQLASCANCSSHSPADTWVRSTTPGHSSRGVAPRSSSAE